MVCPGSNQGGRATSIDEGIAKAMDSESSIEVNESSLISQSKAELDISDIEALPYISFERKGSWKLLYQSSMNKAFCTCGAIAELDSTAITLKRKLGKDVECSYCRNVRISEELEEMRALYSEEDEGWLYS
jgi:hypothetical protein